MTFLFPPAVIPMPHDAFGPVPDPRCFLPRLNEAWPLDFLIARGFDPALWVVEALPIAGLPMTKPTISENGRTAYFTAPGLCQLCAGHKKALFLAPPAREGERLLAAFLLMTHFLLGNDADNGLIEQDTRALLSDLMLNPRFLGLNCGPSSLLVQSLLDHMGLYSRLIRWVNRNEPHDHRRFHITLESYLPEMNAWILIDTQLGLLFEPGFSAFAFLLTSGALQKSFIAAQVAKPYFKIDDLASYDPQARLMALQIQEESYIAPQSPPLTAAGQVELYNAPYITTDILPLPDFLERASYNGTVFIPQRLADSLQQHRGL